MNSSYMAPPLRKMDWLSDFDLLIQRTETPPKRVASIAAAAGKHPVPKPRRCMLQPPQKHAGKT
jgi:hypothetical protein